ncbi:hypothetical protein AM588_10009689 [Phytophthora nicotianae]|uniref:Ras-related protein Rab-21 n=2 Tax=Phytophthora TaxID=4783 RepID=A0A0W8DPK7_PHYNI|nr:hypothetical protein AM588_10009689 [Phytophthora nicotianae]
MGERSTKKFKVVLLGEGRVGKTSILLRYIKGEYDERQVSTLQASYLDKRLLVDNRRVALSLWDTAGQERFHALGPIYYRDADGALLVYDITDAESFRKVRTWVRELRRIVGDDISICIAGNKSDLHRNRKVPEDEAKRYAESVGAAHFDTSAKLNRGLEDVFVELTRRMLSRTRGKKKKGSALIADDDDEDDEPCESKPIEVVALTSSVAPEDPNCTVVFTGTSTGDDSFDLLSLLKQQEADTPESSGPTPHFVRELRDVLAHRVPGLTKQVDHDPLIPSTPPIPPADNAILPPPPTDDMFALPRAPPRGGPRRPSTRANRDPSAAISPTLPRDNKLSGVVATAFNLELQTLLQRIQSSQQPNSIDCIGDSAEENDVDLLSSEKM